MFDVAFIMLLGMLRSLVSVVREKFDQSAETLRKFRSKAQKSATESKGISLETGHGQILDYLDAAVQVNESMLPKKKDREFPLVLSSENDTLIYKKGKLIIHQGSNRPDVIPEEISDQESQRAGKATSSSPNAAPKPALKGGSRSGSSSDSFNSAVTTSPRGSNGSNASNGSKTVSWEQSSTRSEDVKPASSPSEAGTPSQVRRSGSVQQKQAQEASTPVLDLLPLAHQTAFQTFRKLCANDDLLDRPSGLVKRDLQLGVNDDITLLSVLFPSVVVRHAVLLRSISVDCALADFSPLASVTSMKRITSSKKPMRLASTMTSSASITAWTWMTLKRPAAW